MARRTILATDRRLLAMARQITFKPAENGAVFYHAKEGAERARRFVAENRYATRIDDLLPQSALGRSLLEGLGAASWDEKKEVWWELSRKLARAAVGNVHCFGTDRLSRPGPVHLHASRFSSTRYVDTIFEKVELPELDNNPRVEMVYYNGVPLDQ